MISQSRNTKGNVELLYGTYQNKNGLVNHLNDGIEIEVLDDWYSSKTQTTYPSGWKINIKKMDLNFIIMPDILDQEIYEGLPPTQTYWEGKSKVFDNRNNYIGDAFVELSGYRDPVQIEWTKNNE